MDVCPKKHEFQQFAPTLNMLLKKAALSTTFCPSHIISASGQQKEHRMCFIHNMHVLGNAFEVNQLPHVHCTCPGNPFGGVDINQLPTQIKDDCSWGKSLASTTCPSQGVDADRFVFFTMVRWELSQSCWWENKFVNRSVGIVSCHGSVRLSSSQ